MKGLCISFTSSCFLFPVGGGSSLKSRHGEGEGVLKNLKTWEGYQFGKGVLLLGVITLLHAIGTKASSICKTKF